MAQIRITPEELRSAAAFVQAKQGEIATITTDLKTRIDDVCANWEGAAQSSFVESFINDLFPVLNETIPQVLEGLNAQMSGAADAIEQADEQIAQAFRG